MPMSASVPPGAGKNLLDAGKEALWLVSYFEGYQVEKTNQRYRELRWKLVDEVKEGRKLTWFQPALALVQEHGLIKVVSVIDWVFGTHSGLLPYQVENRFSHAHTTKDRKVTSLRQLEFHFGRLVEEMANPGSTGAVEATDFTNQVIRDGSGGVNYGRAFTNPDEEAKVTELVTLFAEFRSKRGVMKEFPAQRTWRWAKSFRVMLASRGYDFDDLKTVVAALRDCSEMDVDRYVDAYDLQRDNWNYLRSAAKLALRKAEMRTGVLPRLRHEDRSPGCLDRNTAHGEDWLDHWDLRRQWEEKDLAYSDCGESQKDMIRRLMGRG